MTDHPPIKPHDHQEYMRYALSLAGKAPPKPTNFCVGAILVDEVSNHVWSTGHTMELPGNTHAEQCCLAKYEKQQASSGVEPKKTTLQKLVLYTTMEPCNNRASGNIPCTETILKHKRDNDVGIQTVYVGVKEPEKFVGENTGRAKLEEAGIDCVHVPGFEEEILSIATAGHNKE